MTILDINKAETSKWSGGTTTQLSIFPTHESYADRHFDWRVSCAKTEVQESSFTPLPGYMRTILTTRGTLELTHNNCKAITLAPYEVHQFDGADNTKARGIVDDFNIMCKSGVCRAHTYVLNLKVGQSAMVGGSYVYAAHGEIDGVGDVVTAKTEAVCIVFSIEYTLKLVLPQKRHRELWHAALAEYTQMGDVAYPFALHMNATDFDEYIAEIRRSESQVGIVFDPTKGFEISPATTYFLVGQNEEKILGTISLRHLLTDGLRNFGGNIGYGVMPSERKRTYATQMLALCLKECRKMGMCAVLLTCDRENASSRKTMTNNGGIWCGEGVDNGTPFDRYSINIL